MQETAVPDEKIWIVLRRAYHAITECLENGLAARGMPVSEFIVLEVLLHNGPSTTEEITRKTRLTSASAKTTIARLLRQQLIFSASDNVGATLGLTEKGRAAIERLYQEHLQDIGRVMNVLPLKRRLELYQSLREIGHHAEQHPIAPEGHTGDGLTPRQLRIATEFMRRRLSHRITTKEIAASLELSDSHFRRAFKTATGVTPYHWLLSARIVEARKLLKEATLPLSEVAIAAGFGDQSHFTRMFQKVMGVSPGVWQRDHHLR